MFINHSNIPCPWPRLLLNIPIFCRTRLDSTTFLDWVESDCFLLECACVQGKGHLLGLMTESRRERETCGITHCHPTSATIPSRMQQPRTNTVWVFTSPWKSSLPPSLSPETHLLKSPLLQSIMFGVIRKHKTLLELFRCLILIMFFIYHLLHICVHMCVCVCVCI